MTKLEKTIIRDFKMNLKHVQINSTVINTIFEYEELYNKYLGAAHSEGLVVFFKDLRPLEIRRGIVYLISKSVTEAIFKTTLYTNFKTI